MAREWDRAQDLWGCGIEAGGDVVGQYPTGHILEPGIDRDNIVGGPSKPIRGREAEDAGADPFTDPFNVRGYWLAGWAVGPGRRLKRGGQPAG